MRDINRYARFAFVAFACGAAAACGPAEDLPGARVEQATPPESPLAPHDLRLVGQNDLQARSAYQPIVHAYGERRILFVGHHAGEALNSATGYIEKNGLSILDVTDPAVPHYLAHMPPTGTEASGTQHVQVHLDGLLRLEYSKFEVIVIDDGSTDATAEIVGKYPVRLISTENRG